MGVYELYVCGRTVQHAAAYGKRAAAARACAVLHKRLHGRARVRAAARRTHAPAAPASAPHTLSAPTPTRYAHQTRAGEKVDDEKDRLLERFIMWAVAVCGRLSSAGYW